MKRQSVQVTETSTNRINEKYLKIRSLRILHLGTWNPKFFNTFVYYTPKTERNTIPWSPVPLQWNMRWVIKIPHIHSQRNSKKEQRFHKDEGDAKPRLGKQIKHKKSWDFEERKLWGGLPWGKSARLRSCS